MRLQAFLRTPIAAVVCFAALSATTAAQAQSAVAVFDFSGSPPSMGTTSVAPHLTVSSLAFGGFGFKGGDLPEGALQFSAMGLGYMEFSVSVDPGWAFDASALTTTAAPLVGGAGIGLRSSIDGFASDLYVVMFSGASQPYSADLTSAAALQDLTGTTTFRIYGARAGSVGGFSTSAIDQVVLSGSVNAVPEPQTYALMLAGLGVLGAAARRRPGR